MKKINPYQEEQRAFLRLLGATLLLFGLFLTAIAMHSLFTSDFDNSPDRFWMGFLGLPLIFIGGAMLQAGYMGAVTRYAAGEVAPVAKDTINYLAEGTQPGVKNIGKALGEGISEGMDGGRGEEKEEETPPPPEYINERTEKEKGTIRERLERLDGLRRDGLIGSEDYEEQKDRILNEL